MINPTIASFSDGSVLYCFLALVPVLGLSMNDS